MIRKEESTSIACRVYLAFSNINFDESFCIAERKTAERPRESNVTDPCSSFGGCLLTLLYVKGPAHLALFPHTTST